MANNRIYAPLLVETKDLKMLRETLCRVSTPQNRSAPSPSEIEKLGRLIKEIDKHRPLGSNGKHGNLHTRTCGCEESEYVCRQCEKIHEGKK